MSDPRWAAAFAQVPGLAAQHLLLAAAALGLAMLVSIPLALAARDRPGLRRGALALAGLVQTIPGLALLALFYPLLLAISALVGGGVPALGFLPSLLALTVYAVLPILRNTLAALAGLDPAVLQAADGVGMTAGQKLRLVEAPLAAPVAMAGVRTAAVWTIGTATLATTVGQPSLGNLIFAGLQTENWVLVVAGCLAAAVLALAADGLLALVERGLAERRRGAMLAGLGGIALGLAAAGLSFAGPARATVTVGAKNFSEQYILARAIGERLERAGYAVRYKEGLGSGVAWRALAQGDIDVYVDYSGTLWANAMGRRDNPPAAQMNAAIARWAQTQAGVAVLGPLGFENAYALAMRRDRARALGIASIADLARMAPRLTLGSDLEFLDRPEWAAIRDAYGLRFAAMHAYAPSFMYRALMGGQADVISAFSSDGRIAAQDLVVLADPRHAVPAYDALLLAGRRGAADARFRAALAPLAGAVPVGRMRTANYMVDRDTDKKSPEEAARWLLPR